MVRTDSLERLLREHAFFQGFNEEWLDLLAGCARNERYEANDLLFREGTTADKMFLIRRGSVSLEIRVPGRHPIMVETVEQDEILGWSWIVEPYRWQYDARALELTRAVSLDATCLRGKMEEDHEMGYLLLKRVSSIMAHRLAAARLRLVDMYAPLSRSAAPVIESRRSSP